MLRRLSMLALTLALGACGSSSPGSSDANVDLAPPTDTTSTEATIDGPRADVAVDAMSDTTPPDVGSDGAGADGANVDSALGDGSSDTAPSGDSGLPSGFVRTPVNGGSGALCAIPKDFVKNGGDPVKPPCTLAADRFSTTDYTKPVSTLRVVTWNVEFGKKSVDVQKALTTDPLLKTADVVLLQEVSRRDQDSVPPQVDQARQLAMALKMDYVAAVEWDRRENSKQGGEHLLAILSKYPIGNATLIRHDPQWNFWLEKKHYGGRATLGVDLAVGGKRLRVYNAHLATRDVTGSGRAKQGAEVRADAAKAGQPALQIVGGDFNTFLCNPALFTCNKPPSAEKVIKEFLAAGYLDLTPGFNGWTQLGVGFFPQRLDWLFAKGQGMAPMTHQVLQAIKAADHVPVVAQIKLP
jgi:endonuclease/exonuclease/phosphatase family metal-dependent hydrolase